MNYSFAEITIDIKAQSRDLSTFHNEIYFKIRCLLLKISNLSKFWKRQISLVVFHVLYSIHYHPFYIEIKFLAVYYIFYSPLSSLYEPNGIFTPFILCINISLEINIQGYSPSLSNSASLLLIYMSLSVTENNSIDLL